MSEPKYKPNQRIEVWRDGKYVPAIIIRAAKWYHKGQCWGYEMQYDPRPITDPITGITPSAGGWTSENCIRERA